VSGADARLTDCAKEIGHDVDAAIVAPLSFRGEILGVLAAYGRLGTDPRFSAADEDLVRGLAASAATAVGTARTVAADRLRRSLEAAEQERRRWARELHDETLQGLAGLSLALRAARRADRRADVDAALDEAIEQVRQEIAGLRALISSLRPAALDELGAAAAIEGLAERLPEDGPRLELDIDLAFDRGRVPTRLDPDLEVAVYRIVQEAATNAAKHSGARTVHAEVHEGAEEISVVVHDDGSGFDPGAHTEGFGLLGMRERVAMAGGTLGVQSAPGQGTVVRATLPARHVA